MKMKNKNKMVPYKLVNRTGRRLSFRIFLNKKGGWEIHVIEQDEQDEVRKEMAEYLDKVDIFTPYWKLEEWGETVELDVLGRMFGRTIKLEDCEDD